MPDRFIHKLKVQADRCPHRTNVADTFSGFLSNASQRDTSDFLALGSLKHQRPYAACIDHHAASTFWGRFQLHNHFLARTLHEVIRDSTMPEKTQ
jgi:hypothetical protein